MENVITTPCGPIRGAGCRLRGVRAYKGIRYATAGRWEYPVQVKYWEGIYDATAYGSCCYQASAFQNEAENPKKSFYYKEFRKDTNPSYSEDCLFLNIWTPEAPEPGSKLPVILYIHGGGFQSGYSNELTFHDPVWPTLGVIAVTINYRVGPLGFACMTQLKEEAGHTGNYGLYDQLAAMQWVKDNIAAFGGDPDCITIMGQSAGAMSVQKHCMSPMTDGLFHRAVLSSGGGISKMLADAPPEKSYGFWEDCMKQAGCETLAQFRALSPEEFFRVFQETQKSHKYFRCNPCVDGLLIPEPSQTVEKQIPYMAGSTSQDMMPPILYTMARDWCASRQAPAYTWFFDRRLPGDDRGAWHSSDLWYWFGTLDKGWRPWTRKDRELSGQMAAYLCNFARTGDPNGEGLPRWAPAGSKEAPALRLGEGDTRMGKPSLGKLWYTLFTTKSLG